MTEHDLPIPCADMKIADLVSATGPVPLSECVCVGGGGGLVSPWCVGGRGGGLRTLGFVTDLKSDMNLTNLLHDILARPSKICYGTTQRDHAFETLWLWRPIKG